MKKTRRRYPCICHPIKPHAAMGLCATCWSAWKHFSRIDPNHPKLAKLKEIVAGHEQRKAEAAAEWKKEDVERKRRNPDSYRKGRNKALRDRYGITIEEFECKLAEQGGVCAICKTKGHNVSARGKLPLYVDHNHGSKQVRGLLCAGCNTLVGYLEVDSNIINSAKKYLESYNNGDCKPKVTPRPSSGTDANGITHYE